MQLQRFSPYMVLNFFGKTGFLKNCYGELVWRRWVISRRTVTQYSSSA
jgi:hypothetical protein